MYRFDNLLEQWAMAYQPLHHNPDPAARHRTFYRISMIDGNSEFIRNHNTCPSPAMSYVAHIDAEMADQNPKSVSYRHVIFMMVRQEDGGLSKTLATDEDNAAEARFQDDAMVQALIAFLYALKSVAGGKSPAADQLQILKAVADVQAPADTGWGVSIDGQVTMTREMREAIRGLQLDRASWNTLPTKLSGWQVCGLTIEQYAPRDLCMTPAEYGV